MAIRILVICGLLSLFIACNRGHSRQPEPASRATPVSTATPRDPVMASPSPSVVRSDGTAAVAGLYDVGQFFVPRDGIVQASNRTAMVVLHAQAGDVFHLPKSVHWGTPPGVGIGPADGGSLWQFLSFTTYIAKSETLYLWIYAGSPSFTRVDDATYRVEKDADVIMYVSHKPNDTSPAVDHTSAINPFGHLLIDPRPVPASAVVQYNTGEGLDVSAAQRAGTLPISMRIYIRTACDAVECFLQYPGEDRAPVDGMVDCGPTVSLVTPTLRLAFETARLPPGQATPYPTPCKPNVSVKAGDIITMPYAPVNLKAYSLDGTPLSIVVAGDGTLYVGPIMPRFTCGPCRGK